MMIKVPLEKFLNAKEKYENFIKLRGREPAYVSVLGRVAWTPNFKASVRNHEKFKELKDREPKCVNVACDDGPLKVAVYGGNFVGPNCLKQTVSFLDSMVRTKYVVITRITKLALKGKDVLILPGGDSGRLYIHNAPIDSVAIDEFMRGGGGVVATCAGAYACSYEVVGRYKGWGFAPSIRAYPSCYEGKVTIEPLSEWSDTLMAEGPLEMQHHGGPAFEKGVAKYTKGPNELKGRYAIAFDYYGKGRIVLIGPYPEFTRECRELFLPSIVRWAGKRII